MRTITTIWFRLNEFTTIQQRLDVRVPDTERRLNDIIEAQQIWDKMSAAGFRMDSTRP